MKKLILIGMALWISCSKKEAINPKVKPLMEAVYASGFVVSDNEYQVFAQAEGIVEEIVAPEGSEVKAGDPIIVLESNEQDSRLSLAWESLELARKNLDSDSPVLTELEASLRSAHARLRLDSTNLLRYDNLMRANATTQVEHDRIKLIYENSRNEFSALRSRYERIRNDMQQANNQAESQWKIAREESGNYSVQSKVDGMVFKVTKQKGELVRRSELVAVVGKQDHYHLQLSVDELDIQRIKEGQQVIIRIDAYPGKMFNGVVTEIFPLVDTRQQSVQVDASLTDRLPGLFSGLAVEANIVIQKKDSALVLPKSLLLEGDSIWTSTDEGKQKVKVKTGMITLDEVEILEGIDRNTQLVPQDQ